MAAFLVTALIVACVTSTAVGSDPERFEPVKLNPAALTFAKQLIGKGQVVIDRKGAWAKDQPSTKADNEFIQQHGFREYAKWHLGIDGRYAENTKRRYKFPYGDFKNVHRCGLLAVQSRARQHGYNKIETAAVQLNEMIRRRGKSTINAQSEATHYSPNISASKHSKKRRSVLAVRRYSHLPKLPLWGCRVCAATLRM
jgi:hypothetical protein